MIPTSVNIFSYTLFFRLSKYDLADAEQKGATFSYFIVSFSPFTLCRNGTTLSVFHNEGWDQAKTQNKSAWLPIRLSHSLKVNSGVAEL